VHIDLALRRSKALPELQRRMANDILGTISEAA
jgi:hypothetical protein